MGCAQSVPTSDIKDRSEAQTGHGAATTPSRETPSSTTLSTSNVSAFMSDNQNSSRPGSTLSAPPAPASDDAQITARKAALGMRNKPKPVRKDSSSSSDSDDYDVPAPKANKYAALKKPADVGGASQSAAPKPTDPAIARSASAGVSDAPLLRQPDLDNQFEHLSPLKGLKLKNSATPGEHPHPHPHGHPHHPHAHPHSNKHSRAGSKTSEAASEMSDLSDLSSSMAGDDDNGVVDDFLASSASEASEGEGTGKAQPANMGTRGKPPKGPLGTASTAGKSSGPGSSIRAKPGSTAASLASAGSLGSPSARPMPSAAKAAAAKSSMGSVDGGGGERLDLSTGELFEGDGPAARPDDGAMSGVYVDDETFDKDWEHLKTLKIVFNRAGLSNDQQRRFLAALRPASFPHGSYIVRQGDPGDAFYIITEGEVAVTRNPDQPGGHEAVITHLYEGHFFGETSLVMDAPRNANVKVVSPSCGVVAMSKDDFKPFLEQDPVFRELITELVRKKEETAKRRAEMMAAAGAAALPPEQLRNEVKISLVTKKGRTANGKAMVNGYVLMQKLGAGSYGTVYLAMSLAHGKKYAVKVVSRTLLKKKQRLGGAGRPGRGSSSDPPAHSDEEVLREVAVMKKLQHPNLTALYEVLDDAGGDKFYLVQEFLELGAVMTESEYNMPLESDVARGYFRDVLAGLDYLHYQGVIHRDIKPSNILISSDGTAKLADFGAAAILKDPNDDRLTEVKGTPAFQPPEVFLIDSAAEGSYHGFPVDVWSLGATLHCMVVGSPPYMADTEWELVEKLKTEEFRLSTAVALDPHLRNLLLRCLTKDPAKRITLKEIMHHPWVTDEGSKPLLSRAYVRLNLHETKATVAASGDSVSTPSMDRANTEPLDTPKAEAAHAGEASRVSSASSGNSRVGEMQTARGSRASEAEGSPRAAAAPASHGLPPTTPAPGTRSGSRPRPGMIGMGASFRPSPAASGMGVGGLGSPGASLPPAQPKVVRSTEAVKNDAASEKQKAHLRALRLRQHQLLRGHTTLSERERDVLAEQKRIAFHADRAMATVEELYIDASGVFSDKPTVRPGDDGTIGSDLSSPSTFATANTGGSGRLSAVPSSAHGMKGRRSSLNGLGLANKSMRHTSTRNSHMTMGAPDVNGAEGGGARRPSITSEATHTSDYSHARTVDNASVSLNGLSSPSSGNTLDINGAQGQAVGLLATRGSDGAGSDNVSVPGMIRTRSGRSGAPARSVAGDSTSSSRTPAVLNSSAIHNDGLDDIADVVSDDEGDDEEEARPGRKGKPGASAHHLLRTSSTSSSRHSEGGSSSVSHGELTRAESQVKMQGGLTRKEDFLMVTAEVDAAEGGGTVVKKVIFRAKGTEGSLSITGGRATMSGTPSKLSSSKSKSRSAGKGRLLGKESAALHEASDEEDSDDELGLGLGKSKGKPSAKGDAKDSDDDDDDSDLGEASSDDDYEGVATLDDMTGSGGEGLDAVLAELAGAPGGDAAGGANGGEAEDPDLQPLTPEEEERWSLARRDALVFSYDDKGIVTPLDVVKAQDAEAEEQPKAAPIPEDPVAAKRHSLLATKDKDKEARKMRAAAAKAARKAKKAASGKGKSDSDDSSDDSSSDDSDEADSDADIGGVDDDDLLGPAKPKHHHHHHQAAPAKVTSLGPVAEPPPILSADDLPPVWDSGVYEGRFVCCPIGKNSSLHLVYGSAEATGRRATMEDRTVAVPSMVTSMGQAAHAVGAQLLQACPEYGFFAVFDGHNGTGTCEVLAQAMHFKLAGALHLLEPVDEAASPRSAATRHPGPGTVDEAVAFSTSCLDIDSELMAEVKPGESISGSTAVMLLVGQPTPASNGRPTLTVGNVGDSRAVLCRGGKAVDLSFDHKCTRPDEKARILAAGGSVVKDRLHGILAVSRAFGDAEHKRPLACEIWGKEFEADPLTAEPEVTREELGQADEFVLLACDGVWDVMTSAQAVSFIRRRLALHRDVGRAARELVSKAIDLGTIDNVSCLVVAFGDLIR